ncbi:hypothetical protein L6R53_24415 [Myxococcota bacterium]|nr:hypothetical protein [Myxococcota bacterium]
MVLPLSVLLACASTSMPGGTDDTAAPADGGADGGSGSDGGTSSDGGTDGGASDGGGDGGSSDGGSSDGGSSDGGSSDGGSDGGTALGDPFDGEEAELHALVGAMFTVRWEQVEETDSTWVEYSVDPGEWRSTPTRAGAVGAHEQLVIGAPYEHEVTWRVVGARGEETASTDDHAIRTDDLPPEVARVTVDLGDPDAWDPDSHFLLTSVSDQSAWSTSVHFWISILDRQGRYVWLYEAPRGIWTLFVKPARDGGAILWDQPYYWTWDDNEDSQVHRMRLDGTIEHSWSTPWLHHSFDDLAPDTIAWNGVSDDTDIVHVSVGDEAPTELWDCMEWIEGSEVSTGMRDESCANNALSWHEATDTILLSEFNHEMLVALDAGTGSVDWYADPSRDLGLAVSDAWYWQHDAHFVADGRVLLFSAEGAGFGGATGGSGAYEYVLDEGEGTLERTWSVLSEDWVADWKGGATRLRAGNTLVNFGDFGGAREYTPAGEIAWEVNFDTSPSSSARNHWIGRTTFLDDLYPYLE